MGYAKEENTKVATMAEPFDDLRRQKQAMRAAAKAQRERQENKDALSRQICAKLAALPEYAAAGMVMFYLDCGAEVRTQPFLPTLWQQGKQVVIPYCTPDRLELFLLKGFEELAASRWGILEPMPELRGRADRKVEPSQLELIVTPGVAFDRRGGRIGYGKGYYDKLLRQVPPGTFAVALSFECQIFPEVPMAPYDVYVDKIVTEAAVYEREGLGIGD
jgi:5-formyltetrahydrofolate cyclo-ligase